MSRLPIPDPGWEESTEGDLDHDLTEEAGGSLEDWHEVDSPPAGMRMVRIVSLVLLVAFMTVTFAGALLAG